MACSPTWGRMRYAPTLVRLKFWGDGFDCVACSPIWGRMRYAPTLVRLKLWGGGHSLYVINRCNTCNFIVWAKMCRGVSHTPSSERWCMSAMNMPYSFQWHVRPREGVCDTPLHLFDWNFGMMASIEGLVCWCEGVCDTPLHMFDWNRGVVAIHYM